MCENMQHWLQTGSNRSFQNDKEILKKVHLEVGYCEITTVHSEPKAMELVDKYEILDNETRKQFKEV